MWLVFWTRVGVNYSFMHSLILGDYDWYDGEGTKLNVNDVAARTTFQLLTVEGYNLAFMIGLLTAFRLIIYYKVETSSKNGE